MMDSIIPINIQGGLQTGPGGQSTGLSQTQNNTTLSNELQNDISLSSRNPSIHKRSNEKYLGKADVFNNAQKGVALATAGILTLNGTMHALEQGLNVYDRIQVGLGVATLGLALIPGIGASLAVGVSLIQPIISKQSQITNKNRSARLNAQMLGAKVNKR